MVLLDLVISSFVLCSSKLDTILQVEERALATIRVKAKGNDDCAGLC